MCGTTLYTTVCINFFPAALQRNDDDTIEHSQNMYHSATGSPAENEVTEEDKGADAPPYKRVRTED